MQLFTHLLSSYLQGMGDFFSALPSKGKECQLRPHPNLPQGRALKKSPFFMTKTENAYDL